MAARNPLTFTKWFDEEAMFPGRNIVETTPDQILDGMEEILDAPALLVGEMFRFIRTTQTGAWAAAMELHRYHLEATDMCGVDSAAGVITLRCSARVWVDSGAEGEVQFQTLSNGDSVSAVFTNTTPVWLTLMSVTADGDGVQEDVQVDLRINSGSTYAYCDGVVVWTVHQ